MIKGDIVRNADNDRARRGKMLRTTFLHVAGPEGQVVPEELHDQGRVLVALLGEGVEFGNRIVKRLLGEVARTVRRVEDLVIEHGEVEGETEANGVGGWEFSDRNVRRGLVGLERLVGAILALVASGKLSKVAVVVAHPVVVGWLSDLEMTKGAPSGTAPIEWQMKRGKWENGKVTKKEE
jgi:hypothetical protein